MAIKKQEALQYIKVLGQQNIVTKQELQTAFDEGAGTRANDAPAKRSKIAEILYYIGGAIVCLGIAIMVIQNWSELAPSVRILITLGSGVAAYFVGLFLSEREPTRAVGSAFYMISALTTPIGLYVLFNAMSIALNGYALQSLIAAIMLATYLLSLLVRRNNIFILLSILFATWLFFSFTSLMAADYLLGSDWRFTLYRVFAIGVAYIVLGYAFSKDKHTRLKEFLYGFGIFGVLGSALTLGGWQPHQNLFWELAYPALVFGALLLSVHIKSKAFLTWGTLFLMAYILKITAVYFSDGLGWPFALVVAGLTLIGVGYMSVSIGRKYLKG